MGREVRIALIHALAHSLAPINEALARDWPEATRMNLLDDRLSADLSANPRGLDAAMHERFARLAHYALDCGCQGILFTCSAFGPCIESVARELDPLPVLKPNEAMIADALASGARRIGLVATFAPTLESMPGEFPAGITVLPALAKGALDALNKGNAEAHDALVAESAHWLAEQGAEVIALAQFSMARARRRVHERSGLPVLTTVDSAVAALRRRLIG